MLSVVIVNFNGIRHLAECLDSVKMYAPADSETILVDNKSTDGSVEFIKKAYPWVKLIQNSENNGFGAGNNLGVASSCGDTILLLNNDAVLLQPLDTAINELRSPGIAVVGCRLVYAEDRFQESWGREHQPWRISLSWMVPRRSWLQSKLGLWATSPLLYESSRDVDWVCGAFMLIRKDAWSAVGGFDDQYFMYVEDVDLCRQVRKRGYRVRYFANLTVKHYGGGGRSWAGAAALANTAMSYLLYSRKHWSSVSVILLRLTLGIIFLGRSCLYAVLATRKRPDYIDKARSYANTATTLLVARSRI